MKNVGVVTIKPSAQVALWVVRFLPDCGVALGKVFANAEICLSFLFLFMEGSRNSLANHRGCPDAEESSFVVCQTIGTS